MTPRRAHKLQKQEGDDTDEDCESGKGEEGSKKRLFAMHVAVALDDVVPQ